MDLVVPALLVVAAATGAAVWCVGRARTRRRTAGFAAFAAEHLGYVSTPSTDAHPLPEARLRLAGLTLQVSEGPMPSDATVAGTSFKLHLADRNKAALRLTLESSSADVPHVPAPGLHPLPLALPAPAATWHVAASDEPAARALLGPAVVAALVDLHAACGARRMALSLSRTELFLAVATVPRDVEALRALFAPVRACMLAVLNVFGFSGPADAPALAAPPPASGAVCPVCGQAIGADPIICSWCATPHHRDCWTWNQRCATYGCRGTRTTEDTI